MTEQRRRYRAEFIRDEPVLWFALLYSASFFGCSAAMDLWARLTDSGTSWAWRYLCPLALAVTPWVGLRGWARRTLIARGGAADA